MAIRAPLTALAVTVAVVSAPVSAAEIGCEGVFNAETTLADLEAEFGAENVVTGEVPGPEGTTMVATTIFPDDPDRTMQVRWWDEENVSSFAGVTLAAGDTGPGGIALGMPIAEVEAINGEPFNLWGFFWDYGGGAGFQSGTLSDIPGGCFVNLRFAPAREDLPDSLSLAISGDIELRSDMPELTEAEVVVREINLGYPFPEELEGGETAE
ncbi:MAG TPA: hypothetical protein VFE52_07730 [Devosia sp.]|jgi:hypothetical protein|nr:hypothetical protein [Devosia sp.]